MKQTKANYTKWAETPDSSLVQSCYTNIAVPATNYSTIYFFVNFQVLLIRKNKKCGALFWAT